MRLDLRAGDGEALAHELARDRDDLLLDVEQLAAMERPRHRLRACLALRQLDADALHAQLGACGAERLEARGTRGRHGHVGLERPRRGAAAEMVTELEVRQRPHVDDEGAPRHLAERALVAVGDPEPVPPELALAARSAKELACDASREELHLLGYRRLGERDDDACDAARAAVACGEALLAELPPRALERCAGRAGVRPERQRRVLEEARLAEPPVRLDDACARDGLEVIRVGRPCEVEALPAHVEAREEALHLAMLALVGSDEDDGLHREPP